MKRILLLILLMGGVSHFSVSQEYTPIQFGMIAGQKATTTGDTLYTFNMGGLTVDSAYTQLPAGSPTDFTGALVLGGMPYAVSYFPPTFNGDLKVSKGYFGQYVQLQWDVIGAGTRIEKFRIFRKPFGVEGDSTLVATLASDETTYQDEFADKGVVYQYWVYAQGIADGLQIPYVNIINGVGFSLPTASASGRITYTGGVAVEGVAVSAKPEGNLSGRSIFLQNNGFIRIPHSSPLELSTGFTFQGWFRTTNEAIEQTLFCKGAYYQLRYNPGSDVVTFTVGNASVAATLDIPSGTFFHVTAAFDPTSGQAKLWINLEPGIGTMATVGSVTAPPNDGPDITIGRNPTGTEHFSGYVDELRLWKRPLDSAEVATNFRAYIRGQRDGLEGYWRINAGITDQIYDLARTGNRFHEHHGFLNGDATWSEIVPLEKQLGFIGITDATGNYAIEGFPYETGGTLYRFTPILGIHQFDPGQQQRFVGEGAEILNDINFTDISSFPLKGYVYYAPNNINSDFPVEGVSILIDGRAAVTSEGRAITTNENGFFNVQVPIGLHSVQVSKVDHVFRNNGYLGKVTNNFKPATADSPPQNDWQDSLASPVIFHDSTLVKLVGKVVGGVVEKNKLLGFGLSKNNLGYAEIKIKAKKAQAKVLNSSAPTQRYAEEHFDASAVFSQIATDVSVLVYPDSASGEFVVQLPPEEWEIVHVRAGKKPDNTFQYSFGQNEPIDLRTTVEEHIVLEDTAKWLQKGTDRKLLLKPKMRPNAPESFSTSDFAAIATYNAIDSLFKGDTVIYVGVDSITFRKRQDFIHRVKPEVTVTGLLGDENYEYTAPNGTKETVAFYTGTEASPTFTFGSPIFSQARKYDLEISVAEKYINVNDGNKEDLVAATDGSVEITNNFAENANKRTFKLDSVGHVTYTFKGGGPNVNTPFKRVLNISTKVEGGSAIQWDRNPFEAIVLGALGDANDFVTAGPNKILTILRDPPGSNSYAYLEQGTTITSATSWEVGTKRESDTSVTLDLGIENTTFVGLGAGQIFDNNVVNDIEIGVKTETSFNFGGEEETSTTFSTRRATSAANDLVGRNADVFVGQATNIVYGTADQVTITKDAGNNFIVSKKKALRFLPQVQTTFVYTQGFIEESLLPRIKAVRDSMLVRVATQAEAQNYANGLERPIYVTHLPLEVDGEPNPQFGSSNNSRTIWGASAKAQTGDGPSYWVRLPTGKTPTDFPNFVDSVHYFNEQIKGWIAVLTENEKQKVEAKLKENVSFDGGASIESSTTIEETETETFSFSFNITGSVGTETGVEILGMGTTIESSLSYGLSTGTGTTDTETNSTTYGYVLEDGDGVPGEGGTFSDYFSVDIKEPKDGFGPVFFTQAGASSCPYEGEDKTLYFNTGTVISNPTLQVERAELEIVTTSVSNVPENRPAEIKLRIANTSPSDASLLLRIAIDDTEGRNGLTIRMDGAPLNVEGRSVLIQPGATLEKTLLVYKDQADKDIYTDVKVLLLSNCTDNPTIDSKTFSVEYVPGCSEVRLVEPKSNWIVNTNSGTERIMNVVFDQFNKNYANFKELRVEYKRSNANSWSKAFYFYNKKSSPTSPGITQAEFDAVNFTNKGWLDEDGDGTQAFDFIMRSLPDGLYDVRVITQCEISPTEKPETPSDIASGIKDTKKPEQFGSPQPADGILSPNDEISIQFTETIDEGLFAITDLTVQGILNSAELTNTRSLFFDGSNNSYVSMGKGLEFANSSFTMEFWLRREQAGFGREQVIFSKGNTATDLFQFGFDASDRFFIDWPGATRMVTTKTFNTTGGNLPDNGWNHFGVAYNHTTKRIFMYHTTQDQGAVLEELLTTQRGLEGDGRFNVGRNLLDGDKGFHGNIHEFRIWNKYRDKETVNANIYSRYNGQELGIVGLWGFDESTGNVTFDDARFRHGQVFAEWRVEPNGSAYAFDGVDDYLQLTTLSSVVIAEDQDFTIEFWFKAPAQTNATFFSNGRGDGSASDGQNGKWAIGLNNSGRIYVANKGNYITLTGDNQNFADNKWHHFALTVNRRANLVVFVDGQSQASIPSTGYGNLIANSMLIGARKEGSGTAPVIDQFLNGSIDEFRIWKLQRKQRQIREDMNAQVAGNTVGLTAYYPFETFQENNGVLTSASSLHDLMIPGPNLTNGGTATFVGTTAANFTTETANISQARPLQNINFSYAINNDKIIITPDRSLQADIEKTVLNITVETVADLNGNSLASPITWTAFMEQNQLKWGTNIVEIEKKLYEPYSFNVDVVNFSGTEQDFSIENLPQWLSASKAGGSIAPSSTEKITFTIDPNINTGTYVRDLFLAGDFGFDEKLIIDLRVFQPLPDDWAFDPNQFQYSMSVVGELEIGGVVSTDTYDQLGVFVGDECRGKVALVYNQLQDNYQAYLNIYSNSPSGERLEFRIWDDSDARVYSSVSPSTAITAFQADANFGLPSAPITFSTGTLVEVTLDIPAGWKWVSFNVNDPAMQNLNQLFTDATLVNGDQVKSVRFFDVYDDQFGWNGSISANGGLQPDQLYLINLQNPFELKLYGDIIDPDTKPLTVVTGWNWIGFISQRNMAINTAMGGFTATNGDILKGQYQFAIFDNGFWQGSLTALIPGEGYKLKAANGGTFSWPNSEGLTGGRGTAEVKGLRATSGVELENELWSINPHSFKESQLMVAEVVNVSVDEEDVLAAFVDGEVRGMAKPVITEGIARFYLNIYGDENGGNISFQLLRKGKELPEEILEKVSFESGGLKGSVQTPVALRVAGEVEGVLSAGNVLVYPNPFNSELTISGKTKAAGEVRISILSLDGKLIGERSNAYSESTQWQVTWNGMTNGGQELAEGVYIVLVKTPDTQQVFRILKK